MSWKSGEAFIRKNDAYEIQLSVMFKVKYMKRLQMSMKPG